MFVLVFPSNGSTVCEYETELKEQADGDTLANTIKQTSEIINSKASITLGNNTLTMTPNQTVLNDAVEKGKNKKNMKKRRR